MKMIINECIIIKMITPMFITIFMIFHDLTIFYENFMTLILQEANLFSYKMNFNIISI